MLVVIPISKSDERIVDSFCESIVFFGPYSSHDILFVHKASDKELANKVKAKLSYLFKTSLECIVNENVKTGWPEGPNAYWRETIFFLKKIKNKNPWYWMESDVTPMKNDWLDEMQWDYYYYNKPFFGSVSNASYNYPFHLSGCAIYPHDIGEYTNHWKWINNSTVAFDLICSTEIMKHQVFDSDKMLNYFKTYKYRLEKDDDFCFEKIHIPFDLGRQKDIEGKKIQINKTLVVHGCKDGSLFKTLKNNYTMEKNID